MKDYLIFFKYSEFRFSGPEYLKMKMVKALAEMELTDHSKETLFKEGALQPLLQMLSLSDADGKRMAIKAIQKLSSFGPNGLQIIRDGAISPLLDLLFQAIPASSNLRDQVAATILNITVSAAALQTNEALSILKSDAEISRLFSLVMLTGPTIQQSILGTFYALCQLPSAKDMRTKLRQVTICPSHLHESMAIKLFYYIHCTNSISEILFLSVHLLFCSFLVLNSLHKTCSFIYYSRNNLQYLVLSH